MDEGSVRMCCWVTSEKNLCGPFYPVVALNDRAGWGHRLQFAAVVDMDGSDRGLS